MAIIENFREWLTGNVRSVREQMSSDADRAIVFLKQEADRQDDRISREVKHYLEKKIEDRLKIMRNDDIPLLSFDFSPPMSPPSAEDMVVNRLPPSALLWREPTNERAIKDEAAAATVPTKKAKKRAP
jgi:hypothetical protein